MMNKMMRKRWENIPKNGIFKNNYIYIYCKSKNGFFFSKSPIFKLAKSRIHSKRRRLVRRRKLPSPPPPSSQPSLQQKQKKSQLMCKVISKKRMSTFKTQTYLACISMVA
jgi:hypothetical protein